MQETNENVNNGEEVIVSNENNDLFDELTPSSDLKKLKRKGILSTTYQSSNFDKER